MILKPMSVGEILDHILKLLKGQWKAYLSVVGLGVASILGLGLIITIVYFVAGKILAIIAGIVALILALAIHLATIAGLVKMASEQILDRKMSSIEAYRSGFGKAWSIFLGATLYYIFLVIGGFLLIIPGIYLFIAFIFFIHTIVIENNGPWDALKRSKALTKGCWWRCLGIMLLISLFLIMLSFLPRLAIELLGTAIFKLVISESVVPIISILLSLIVSLLTAPLSIIATTLLYYDLRVRKENLDLQVMVNHLTEKNAIPLPGE